MVKKYKKKPVIIEAIKYDGKNQEEIFEFTEKRAFLFGKDNALEIPTSEGNFKCSVGDYVIKEPFDKNRRFYPCKPDIFNMTYEGV